MADAPSHSETPLTERRASPLVGLALLEAMRSADTPVEMLEDETFEHSLPRRLGLSELVEAQIRRFRELVGSKGATTARQLADLYALVDRRADAPVVFARAGRWLVAHEATGGKERAFIARLPIPNALRRRLAMRAVRRVAELVSPGSAIHVESSPLSLAVEGCLPAYACGTSSGCHVITTAFTSALGAFDVEEARESRDPVSHPLCESRGDASCIWRVAE
jgi:hypothetical protein